MNKTTTCGQCGKAILTKNMARHRSANCRHRTVAGTGEPPDLHLAHAVDPPAKRKKKQEASPIPDADPIEPADRVIPTTLRAWHDEVVAARERYENSVEAYVVAARDFKELRTQHDALVVELLKVSANGSSSKGPKLKAWAASVHAPRKKISELAPKLADADKEKQDHRKKSLASLLQLIEATKDDGQLKLFG